LSKTRLSDKVLQVRTNLHYIVDLHTFIFCFCFVSYARALEAGGKFRLIIWPEHCIQGSPGHAVVAPLRQALDRWVDAHAARSASVQWVLKGENCLTEMYVRWVYSRSYVFVCWKEEGTCRSMITLT
jgi:nicotinamidase-related amidase